MLPAGHVPRTSAARSSAKMGDETYGAEPVQEVAGSTFRPIQAAPITALTGTLRAPGT